MTEREIKFRLSAPMFEEVRAAAKARHQDTTSYARELVEAVAATRRLDALPDPPQTLTPAERSRIARQAQKEQRRQEQLLRERAK